MSYAIPTQHLPINSDYDVVSLRQHVRQLARLVGLDLIHQAKLATASTTIARSVLGLHRRTTFVMQTLNEAEGPVLQIACAIKLMGSADEHTQIEQALRLDEVRLLVDHLDCTHDQHDATVTLRVWLTSTEN